MSSTEHSTPLSFNADTMLRSVIISGLFVRPDSKCVIAPCVNPAAKASSFCVNPARCRYSTNRLMGNSKIIPRYYKNKYRGSLSRQYASITVTT